MTVSHNAIGSPLSITLTGTGLAPVLLDSPRVVSRTLAFGTAPLRFSSLSGKVSLDNGKTLEGTLFVFNSSGALIAQSTINSDGSYTISGLPEGTVQVFAEVVDPTLGLISGGFDANGDARPDGVTLTAGQNVQNINIILSTTRPVPPSDPVNQGANVTLKLSRPGSTAQADTLYGVKAGEEILVWAHAQNVVNLAGFLVEVGYDAAQVTFKRMSENGPDGTQNILFQAGGKALFITNPPANGKVELDGAMLGQTPEQFVTGSGLLGVFRFIATENIQTATFHVTRTILQSGTVEEPLTVTATGIATSASVPSVVEIAGPIKMDLDIQTGNQNLIRKAGTQAGDTITLQLFAEGLSVVTGYGFFVQYDTNLLTFTQHRLNANFIPGAFERVADVNGKINVALASFGGGQTSQGDGLLGELTFTVQQAFTDSTTLKLDTVVLNRPGGITETLKQVSIAILVKQGGARTPDFNGDKAVDFVDFLLFANAFGGADPKFDLDNSGSVGFGDFLIFAAAFGTSVS